MDNITEKAIAIIDLANKNSGFVTVVVFIASLLIAWISGAYSYINKTPFFKIKAIDKCTFGSIVKNNLDEAIHKTAFVFYLEITNKGKAASTFKEIKLGYVKRGKSKLNWIQYFFVKFYGREFKKMMWINNVIIKNSFGIPLPNNEDSQFIPYLLQGNTDFYQKNDTYLEVGKISSGVVYFEQEESFGNYQPNIINGKTAIYIKIKDAFDNYHVNRFNIEMIDFTEALKFNSNFGQTQSSFLTKQSCS